MDVPSEVNAIIAQTLIPKFPRTDPGSLAEAVAACETAWIPWLFTMPGQIFLLPGRSRRRETAVWNLWIISHPWPEELARQRLVHRNVCANLRPLWTAHIDRDGSLWRMKTWSWNTIQTSDGLFHAQASCIMAGRWERVFMEYPPDVPSQNNVWYWDVRSLSWVSESGQSTWIDSDLLRNYLQWIQEPATLLKGGWPQQLLAFLFETITVLPTSRRDAFRRWWRRH